MMSVRFWLAEANPIHDWQVYNVKLYLWSMIIINSVIINHDTIVINRDLVLWRSCNDIE